MKKIFLLTFAGLLPGLVTIACPLCEEQQPAFFRDMLHGPGPQGPVDYIITIVAVLFVILVLFYSIKFMVKPGEKNPEHIKYSILD